MATPLFCGFFPLDETDFTSNTDGSGEITTTLPAGLYWAAPYEIVTLCGSTTASTSIVHQGGDFPAVGEVIEIYGLAGDAIIATGLTVLSVDEGGATIEVDQAVTTAKGDRLYPVGSIQGNIEARIAASDVAAGSDTTQLKTDLETGQLYWITDSGATITWDDPYLARILRYDEDSVLSFDSNPLTAVGERPVLGWFQPSKAIVEDLPRRSRPGQTYVSDDGTFRKLSLPRIERHALTVRYRGGPRATDWAEIHAWEDLTDLLEAGYKFRFYPDRTATLAPYARKTNPYGWSEWYVESGAEYEPRNPKGGVYDNWTQSLALIAV